MSRGLNGGLMMPSLQAPAPTLTVSAPLNDTQLVALLAAHRPELLPADAVAWAVELVVESVAQTGPSLGRKIDARMRGE